MWFGTEDGLNKYDGYRFTIYRPEPENPNSMNDNIILSIYEDMERRLWIGTNGGGINIFDREKEQFFHFRHDPDKPDSLSSGSVNCIYEDRRGNLWIGTGGGGLDILVSGGEKGTRPVFAHYQHLSNNPNSLSNNLVTSIYEDQRGILWIGTAGEGLNKMLAADDKYSPPSFIHYKAKPNDPNTQGLNNITAINEDLHGTLWIGTQDGLFAFVQEKETFISFKARPGDTNCISHNYVRRIYKDNTGVLWIGTDGGGINKLVPGKNKDSAPIFIHYQYDPNNPNCLSNNAVESLFEDRSGVLWIGVYHGGLNKLILRDTGGFDREREQFVHYQTIPNNPNSLSHNAVNAICVDCRGILWVGTDGGGLNKIVPPSKNGESLTFHHYCFEPKNPNSLSDNIVTSICEDHLGTLWIGTYTGGLNKLVPVEYKNSSHTSFTHYKREPGNPRSLSNDFVMSIYEDRSGILWIGTIGGGLNWNNRKNDTFIRYETDPDDSSSLSNNNVYAIYEDRAGNLWVGTLNGLNKLGPRPNRNEYAKLSFIRHQNDPEKPSSISSNFVRVIYEDRAGVLWIGTNGGGLNKLLPGDNPGAAATFSHYREKDGLPNNVILGILEDNQGNLWLSTNKGLSKFNPKSSTFKNFYRRDGLQSDEFNRGAFFKSKSGEMFFGGNNGFNIFFPGRIKGNLHVPPIVITDFQVFNKSLPIGKLENGRTILKKFITESREIKLSYKDYVFSFQFAALHYVNPSKNRYAYIMEGLETEWNYVGARHFVTYTTLPSGNYVFRVKGSNNDGVWNEEGISLKITILPPFWKTWWFIGLVVVVILLSGLGIHFYRVRQIITRIRKKYEKTSISDEKAESYLRTLLNYMKMGKPYLHPDLTLHKLSKMVVIPYHYLSQIINNKLNKIFFDFINEYRIEEAVKKLADPKERKKSIHQVANEVGFHSQSAFNRAFKKCTQKTPSEFINQCRIKDAAKKLTDPREKQKTIRQIAIEVGFSSFSSFNRTFKKITRKTPSQYRKKSPSSSIFNIHH